MPAPIVALVMRSIRMNAPVSRQSVYSSNAIGWSSEILQTPISFNSSFFGGKVFERVDVHLVLRLGDRGRHLFGADLQPIRPSGSMCSSAIQTITASN